MNKRRMKMCVTIVTVGLIAALATGALAAEKLPKKYTETITTKDGAELTLDMVLIPGGTFTMISVIRPPKSSVSLLR